MTSTNLTNAQTTPSDFNLRVANKLRSMRAERGMTVIELSEASGVDATRIDRYETGSQLTLDAAARLAHALNVSLEELAAA